MKSNLRKYLLATAGVAALGFISLAWTGNHQNKTLQAVNDTVPRQKSTRTPEEYKRDFDKELNDLDKAMKGLRNIPDVDMKQVQAEINAAMKQVEKEMANHKIDMEKMQKELQASLSKIDAEKIQADLKKSLKELEKLDLQEMQKELKESLSNLDENNIDLKLSLKELDKIDLEKMRKETEHSMEEMKVNVDAAKISREIQESMKKVDMEKMKLDMEKVRGEVEKNKDNFKFDLDKIQKDLERTKSELKGYQQMVYEMEKDGLLSTKADYTISYENEELTINGQKQPQQVSNKYKKYFSKDGITIRKEKGEMNINIQ
jgi:chromosome segregation ATPase